MRVLIVDDEAPARSLLREYLRELTGWELAGECGDGLAAVAAIAELSPDVVLLDVAMPGLDGFEVLEVLDQPPEVIFTTAYDEHAVHAFEVGAVDYLLKPFSAARLEEALERARARRRQGGSRAPQEVAARALRQRRPLARVLVKEGGRIHVLPAEEIDYIEAAGDRTRFHRRGQCLEKAQTLGELEELLDPRLFVRIHRSFLLRLDCLARLELYAKDSRVAILRDGTRLPVSRAGYGRLRELL